MEVLKNLFKISLLVLFAVPASAEQIALDHFGYLNNNEAPAILDQTESQDLLNVDVTPGGKSVKKRSGYGLYKTLASGRAIHGGIHFFDGSGNDVQIWASSTSLWGIVSNAAPTQLISSGTVDATWDCADTQGNAYCVSSSRDALIKTDGATKTWHTSPLGTMVAVTPERLLIAGVSGNTNLLYVSKANDFTNFTIGNGVDDAFTEAIGAPGGRITHIEYACGRWLWWKDQSFGYLLGTDQTNLTNVTVSNSIGTFDNSSAIAPDGSVWFRANDSHIYRYDCSALQRMSTAISPAVQLAGRRISNSWTQTSQANFEAGASNPTGQLSFTLSPGSIFPSSFTATRTSNNDFSGGTFNSVEYGTASLRLARSVGNITNHSFESGSGGAADNWTYVTAPSSSWFWETSANPAGCPSLSAQQGSRFIFALAEGCTSPSAKYSLTDDHTAAVISSGTVATGCGWNLNTISVPTSYIGQSATLRITYSTSCGVNSVANSSAYLLSGNISFYAGATATVPTFWVDNVSGGHSSISSGTYTSPSIDTGLTYSRAYSTATVTLNTNAVSLSVQTSTSTNGPWTTMSSTGTNFDAKRYLRYISTFSVTSTQDALSTLDDIYFVATASGSYYSAVNNAPNLSSWDTFTTSKVDGGGSHTFYIRASTNSFTVLSSTPSWVAQTAGGVVSASTGTYFQVRDDFSVVSATDPPSLSDFSVNWYEGTAADKAYATYFDDAIWWALAYGSGQSANNYIFKYDLLNEGWTLYDIPAAGFAAQNNNLYFGSASSANVFRYGSSTSDNGTAINAYWRSKDFTGADPWLENEYTQLDTVVRRNQNQTLTVSYILDASDTATSFSVPLSSSTSSVIRYKKLLPTGKTGGLFSVKFSDNSATSAWEVLGFRALFRPQTYRPTQ